MMNMHFDMLRPGFVEQPGKTALIWAQFPICKPRALGEYYHRSALFEGRHQRTNRKWFARIDGDHRMSAHPFSVKSKERRPHRVQGEIRIHRKHCATHRMAPG